MSENVFEEIGHGVEVAAKDVAVAVKDVVEAPAKIVRVVDVCWTERRELAPEIATLMGQAKTVLADGVAAAAAKGLNWAADVALVTAVEALAKYVAGTFLPAIDTAAAALDQAAGAPAPVAADMPVPAPPPDQVE